MSVTSDSLIAFIALLAFVLILVLISAILDYRVKIAQIKAGHRPADEGQRPKGAS